MVADADGKLQPYIAPCPLSKPLTGNIFDVCVLIQARDGTDALSPR